MQARAGGEGSPAPGSRSHDVGRGATAGRYVPMSSFHRVGWATMNCVISSWQRGS
jgi:hypothetical protein